MQTEGRHSELANQSSPFWQVETFQVETVCVFVKFIYKNICCAMQANTCILVCYTAYVYFDWYLETTDTVFSIAILLSSLSHVSRWRTLFSDENPRILYSQLLSHSCNWPCCHILEMCTLLSAVLTGSWRKGRMYLLSTVQWWIKTGRGQFVTFSGWGHCFDGDTVCCMMDPSPWKPVETVLGRKLRKNCLIPVHLENNRLSGSSSVQA